MEHLFKSIVDAVKSKFGCYHVQAEVVPDSPQTRLIAVYDVSIEDVPAVRQTIKDLDWDVCQPNGLAALPHVVNAAKTSRFYPQYSRHTQNAPCLAVVFKWYIRPEVTSGEALWSKPNAPVCANCSSDLANAA